MKNKILIFLLFFMGFSFETSSQNLVPNYSFEDTIKCPTSGYFQGYITSWGGNSPEYFSKFCNDPGIGGNPSNNWGFQHAHTGNAYAGIYTFVRSDSGSTNFTTNHNVRDYIQTQLISSLSGGIKYYVTFYISLGDSVKYACNNIGAYFSDSSLNFSSRKALTYHSPQVQNDTEHNPLTDKVNWMKVSSSFIAQGGEQYIIIGNFKNDAHSDSVFVNSSGSKRENWDEAYYYIDDIIVSTDSNYADSLFTSINEIQLNKERCKLFPNPNNGQINIELQNISEKTQLLIYNCIGEDIYSTALVSYKNSVNIGVEPDGIYFYRLLTQQGKLIQCGKFLIKH